jgi:catechol 2,3-dioxygenase-like lactoylglutathione lyase family enzyme
MNPTFRATAVQRHVRVGYPQWPAGGARLGGRTRSEVESPADPMPDLGSAAAYTGFRQIRRRSVLFILRLPSAVAPAERHSASEARRAITQRLCLPLTDRRATSPALSCSPTCSTPLEITMPSIKAIEARIDVANVTRSAAFYADVLGFEVGPLWPDPLPQFAILNRDGLRLQLGRREDTSVRASHPACTLWFDVAGLADLHSTIKEKVNIEWGPEVYFYQRREFAFRDPDGYLVILSEVTDDPPTCEKD